MLRDATTGFAVSTKAGCNGVEAAVVVIAGIVAFPASLKNKAIAFLAGFLVIQALNIVRIISLFYLGHWSYTIFEWFQLLSLVRADHAGRPYRVRNLPAMAG